MTSGHTRSRARQGNARAWVLLVLAAVTSVIALAGCGSSKPAYCTERTTLQNSVKGLTSAGISGLKTQIKQVESDASTVVSSAKSDFPSETSAITSSVDALKSSLAALPSSPSAAQVVIIGQDAASVVSSVNSFVDASNSKCS
jgi:hypothetical protein